MSKKHKKRKHNNLKEQGFYMEQGTDYFDDISIIDDNGDETLDAYFALLEEISDENICLKKDEIVDILYREKAIEDAENLVKEETTQNVSEEFQEDKMNIQQRNPKLTSYAVAKKIAEKADIVVHNGSCFFFNGIYFECIDEKKLMTLAREFVGETELLNIYSSKFFADIHNLLKLDERLNIDAELDVKADGRYISFRNGTVDILTGERYAHNRRFHTFYCLDADYLDEDSDLLTPVWDDYVESSTENEMAEELVMAMLAYLVSPFVSAKKFFVLGTAPNSGKSVIASFLERVMDERLISHVEMGELGGNFGMAPLKGKILNFAMDLPDKAVSKSAVSRLKMITGLDMVQINEKYEKQISCFCRTKFMFGTNHPLRFDEVDRALMERLVFVPFTCSINKEDRDMRLVEKLYDERDEILTKAVIAAHELYESGFYFPGEEAFKKAAVYRPSDEIVEEFLLAYCEVVGGDEVFTSTFDLYCAYTEFCRKHGIGTMSKKVFSEQVSEITGIVKERAKGNVDGHRNQRRGFRGLLLKKDDN